MPHKDYTKLISADVMDMTVAEAYARCNTEERVRVNIRQNTANMQKRPDGIYAPKLASFSSKGLRFLLTKETVSPDMLVSELVEVIESLVGLMQEENLPAYKDTSVAELRYILQQDALGALYWLSDGIKTGLASTAHDYCVDDALLQLEAIQARALNAHGMSTVGLYTEVTTALETFTAAKKALCTKKTPSGLRTKAAGSFLDMTCAMDAGYTNFGCGSKARLLELVKTTYLMLGAAARDGIPIYTEDGPAQLTVKKLDISTVLLTKVNNPKKAWVEALKDAPVVIPKTATEPTQLPLPIGPVEAPPEMAPKKIQLPWYSKNMRVAQAVVLLEGIANRDGLKIGKSAVCNAAKALESIDGTLPLRSAVHNMADGTRKSVCLGMSAIQPLLSKRPWDGVAGYATVAAAQRFLAAMRDTYKGGEQHSALMWALDKVFMAFNEVHPEAYVKNSGIDKRLLEYVYCAEYVVDNDGVPVNMPNAEYEAGLWLGDVNEADGYHLEAERKEREAAEAEAQTPRHEAVGAIDGGPIEETVADFKQPLPGLLLKMRLLRLQARLFDAQVEINKIMEEIR